MTKRNGGRRNGNGRHNGNGTHAHAKQHRAQQPLKNQPQDATPKAVDDELLRVLALDLRRDGASYRAIAAAMTQQLAIDFAAGKITEARVISKDIAHKLVVEGLRELKDKNAETANEVRMLEIERCDVWLARLNSKMDTRSTPRVIDTMLRISERRARLLGLDAETQSKLKLVGADDGPIGFALMDARSNVRDKLDALKRSIETPQLRLASGGENDSVPVPNPPQS